MTLFDVISLGCIGAGIGAGAVIGEHQLGGTAGGWAGAIIGGVAGFFAGRIPLALALASAQRDLRRMSPIELRRKLHGEHFTAHMVLPELMRRGEDVSSERPYVLELLSSDSPHRRFFGLAALRIAFPEDAWKIQDYRPSEPTEKCRAKVAGLL